MGPGWRKSTFSGEGENNDCVEVAALTGTSAVAVRDSKQPALVIRVPSPAWDFFLRELS
jgi:hypothetical protein